MPLFRQINCFRISKNFDKTYYKIFNANTSLINRVNKKYQGVEIMVKNTKENIRLKADAVLVSIGWRLTLKAFN